MSLSTHVLDTAQGRPAQGLAITLESWDEGARAWQHRARGETDADGRVKDFGVEVGAGRHRLIFDTEGYLAAQGQRGFYPYVPVVFEIADPAAHYHVPLLLSPWGFSTYRGS